jgi:hypothetical protein
MSRILNGIRVSDADHAYYSKLAVLLEPDAIEPLQRGTFSYAVGADETKYLLTSWSTRLGAGGRLEVREPFWPLPLRNVTVTGLESGSTGVFLDPTLASYVDARDTYFDRLNALATYATKYIPLTSASETATFLPGAYGAILLRVSSFNFTWVSPRFGAVGYSIHSERGDVGANDYMRYDRGFYLPVNKNFVNTVLSGASGGVGTALGGIVYVLLPSTWSAITDPNTYDFRDDFMGASLDTGSDWTRAQSSAGNVEIDTNFGWLKVTGNGNWGDNGIYSQSSIARANGKVFLADVFIPAGLGAAYTTLVAGFSDGGGQSYTNFAHGILMSASGPSIVLNVFEDGNNRGVVGSGMTAGNTYRMRITLGASNNAAYAIQGGSEYPALGGASWTDITPGTTSSATTPLHAGVTKNATGLMYVGDVKIY